MKVTTAGAGLRPGSFAEFFTALWGEDKPPFAWQTALAKRVLGSGRSSETAEPGGNTPENAGEPKLSPWPEAISLPTASGKTACMDIAVFALAAQANWLDMARPITAPRRIFFVVDRRIIVDEAYERARQLATRLVDAREGILKTVADNLRRISHGGTTGFGEARPLAVHALRGGMYRSEAWACNPLQPTIVASTVDQIGSRLLFRAYGRSSSTWPIYAGLAANDSLILLDEAHCAQPFLQTLRAVRRFRGRAWTDSPLGRCFHPVVMSATPPPGIDDVFDDESKEKTNPHHPLGKRQLASKPAVLTEVKKATGGKAAVELSKALAKTAVGIVGEGRRAILVFVNRVATARETFRRLSEHKDIISLLLTGRMRPVDKDAVVGRLQELNLHSSRSADRDLEKPVIVIATQTLEVGADLDFDGLITECASLDALRQRFGRLNRMGRDIDALAKILIRGDQAKPKKGQEADPIYGRALTNTWKWLNKHKNQNGDVDFGIAHLDRLLPAGDSLTKLNAPSSEAPVMLPAHVDSWAQTAPEPRPTPDVAPFLHGPQEGAPDVQVCWRADLDLTNATAQEHALESLNLCPPSSNETLPVPISVFKRWLAGRDPDDESGDVEGVRTSDEPEADSRFANRRIIRWRGAKTKREHVTSNPTRIRPGDVVVIPVAHPGPWTELGDLPLDAAATPATLDVGDPAYRTARAKAILRLHPALVATWPDSVTAKRDALVLLKDLERKYEDDPDGVAETVHDLLTKLSEQDFALPRTWTWLREAAGELGAEFSGARLRRECRIAGGQAVILAGRRRLPKLAHEADIFSDENEAFASGTSHRNRQPVPLFAHLAGVERFARRHAIGSGLSQEIADALSLAGSVHDVGKADPRFQSMLRGGSPWHSGTLLAKSAGMPRTRAARRLARDTAGYPAGRPHPLLSVRLVEEARALLPERDDLRDLVLHLVASHHGQCRPFAPVISDDQEMPVVLKLQENHMRWTGPTRLERLDSGVADRYWRLTRQYGWWGLAWLEALLRLADWRQSEWEERHHADA